MADERSLVPAAQLVAKGNIHFPNESEEYRRARNALLAEEIELRRHLERVAELRRALPPGGRVSGEFVFEGESGTVTLAELFAGRQTLALYSYMFGTKRARPCPMCTSMLSAWEGTANDFTQRVALAVVARSPIRRLMEFKKERGWRHLTMVSDPSGDYTRQYVSADDADIPAFNVFTRRAGVIRHFWSGEMGPWTADPGQDPRGAPDLNPLWTLLDFTPEGRDPVWYPRLDYSAKQLKGRRAPAGDRSRTARR